MKTMKAPPSPWQAAMVALKSGPDPGIACPGPKRNAAVLNARARGNSGDCRHSRRSEPIAS
jgi:hypothetical protein